jgi:amphi-Trp domain-containing protein
MAKKTTLLKSEERKDLQSVVAFLRRLADQLAENQVVMRQGTQEITMTVPDTVVLEVEVEEKLKKGGLQRQIEIEIEWMEGGESGAGVTLG